MVSLLILKYRGILLFTDHHLQGLFAYLAQRITSQRPLPADGDVLALHLHWSMYILPVRIKFEVIYLIFYDASEECLTVTKQQINNAPLCRSKHLETIINGPT